MRELDVEAVDVRDELRQRVQAFFDLAPVVLLLPVTRQFLHTR
jgi:hypothetical protein